MKKSLLILVFLFGLVNCGGGDSGVVPTTTSGECFTTVTWNPPTNYADCDPNFQYLAQQNCGKPLPSGYLTRYNLFMYMDEGGTAEIEIMIPDVNLISWELRNLPPGEHHFNMTASGHEADKKPDPDTGVVLELTSDFSNWTAKICPQ